MKKTLPITFLIWLLAAGSAAKAFAAQTVSFSLPEVRCAPNRLIQVPCVATGTGKFCAATFSFQFDKSLLEIRKVTPYKGAKAVFHQADTLKISYVHADGIDLSAAPEIFTLEFKATGEGTTPISFEKDTKTDSAAAEKKSDHTSGSGQSRTKSGSSAKSQSADKTETETTKPTVPITVEKHDSGGDRAVAVAVLTVSVVGGMIFFSWFIPKLLKEHRAKKKLPSADTTDDKDRE